MKKPIILKNDIVLGKEVVTDNTWNYQYTKSGVFGKQWETENAELIAKIEEEIKLAEGRAKARTIDVINICGNLLDIQNGLNIPKKYMDCIEVSINVNAQDFPNAYKYTPESTWFDAVFHNGTWRITDIYRSRCTNQHTRIYLTDDAKAKIIERMENGNF